MSESERVYVCAREQSRSCAWALRVWRHNAGAGGSEQESAGSGPGRGAGRMCRAGRVLCERERRRHWRHGDGRRDRDGGGGARAERHEVRLLQLKRRGRERVVERSAVRRRQPTAARSSAALLLRIARFRWRRDSNHK